MTRISALAFDYDGTLATHGIVPAMLLDRLRAARRAGFRLLLVTGRQEQELARVCPACFDPEDSRRPFDLLVLENGAILVDPSTNAVEVLATNAPSRVIAELRQRLPEEPLIGRVVIATWMPHDEIALQIFAEHVLPWSATYNKRHVMLLPNGIDKGSGLLAGLSRLGISPAACAAFGDAENDLPLFAIAGHAVAPANALDQVKRVAKEVLSQSASDGVAAWLDTFLAKSRTANA